MQARMTFSQCAEKLGSRASRKIGNNTYLHRLDADTIALRLHATDVVTFRPGTVTLDSGGWRTVTTKDRLNYVLPVYSEKGTWYVGGYKEARIVYFDGITFAEDGELLSDPIPDPTGEAAKVKRQIAGFAKLCGETLAAGMPVPGGGDCFYCQMRTADGDTLGDSFNDVSHLESHMEEGYVVPSLLYNAVAEKGYPYPTIILGWSDRDAETMGGRGGHTDMVKAAVRDYMKRRLLPGQTGGRPTAGPNPSTGFAVR